jgi:MoxR-like ATPase
VDSDIRLLNEMVARESAFVDSLLAETSKVIVGQKAVMERVLIGLLCNGHVLLEGVPGLAKTLAISTLARAIDARFQRIQFTPDLLPADLIGTQIYNQASMSFSVRKGPVFANLVLADEINRAPAKVQSALLESMQERQVTIGDQTFPLPDPFLVLATQNPIEQEGTYPLPEAQIDRFMMLVRVGYPNRAEERTIIDRMSVPTPPTAAPVVGTADILRARSSVAEEAGMKDLRASIQVGASPRASLALVAAARAHAFMRHRGFVTPEDIKAIGPDVLRHRVSLTYEAEAEELTSDRVIQRVFERVEVP